MAKMAGMSPEQITCLIGRYKASGAVRERSHRRNRFERHYRQEDVKLLASVDEARDALSGPATQEILYREFYDYGNASYQRLTAISVAHIYNLRKRRVYQETRIV